MARVVHKTFEIIERGLDVELHPAAQLYVSRHGELIADAAFGEASPGKAMTVDHLVLWMSAVKPITAVAIAREWERGRIDLDAPVARYVPEFAENGKESVTIRHVLTHTGGFPNYFVPWSIGWDEAVANVCALPLEAGWKPGKRAGYHASSGWQVLGEVVRRVSGQPYADYLRERVFLPLGMTDSWVGIDEDAIDAYGDRIAITRSGNPGKMTATNHRAHHLTQCRPGANGRGPIRELGRFYEMLLNGGAIEGQQFLKPETVKLFTGLHREGMYDETFNHAMNWGLGFIRNSGGDAPYSFGDHASDETFGHGGMQSSIAFADPAHGLVVAWACTGMPGEPLHQERNRAINNGIYKDLALT